MTTVAVTSLVEKGLDDKGDKESSAQPFLDIGLSALWHLLGMRTIAKLLNEASVLDDADEDGETIRVRG